MTRQLRLFIVVFETVLFTTGFLVGAAVRFSSTPWGDHEHLVLKAALMTLVVQGSLFYNGLYEFRGLQSVRSSATRFLAALVMANLLLGLFYWLVPELTVGRGVALLAMGVDAVAFALWRLALMRFMRRRPLRRVLIMGDGELALVLARLVRDHTAYGYRFSGFLAPEASEGAGEERVGDYADVAEISRRNQVDVVAVAMADRRGTLPVNELLDLKFSGVEVIEGVDLYELFTEKIYISGLKPSWMIFGHGFRHTEARRFSKRILDVTASIFGLVVAAGPMLLTALLVRLTSAGPAIYAQERVGEFGRIFTLYKFRSMRTDAEATGPKLASAGDDRVTPVGRFIRKTRLDELPQLFNVLRGDMSLVGPRPERPFFVVRLQREIPLFRQRLFAKPGVTGLAQVKFRYAERVEDHIEKLQYDLAYIKNMSLLYDVQLILETIKVMIFRSGAR